MANKYQATVLRAEFRVTLEVEGVRFDIAQFSSDWAINRIPQATCVLAIGRQASDGTTPANVHTKFSSFQKMSAVKVHFKPKGEWSTELSWPEEEQVIFEGRLQSTGYSKQGGKIYFVAFLQHWLGDLAFASSMNANSHVGNPTQYTFPAVMPSRVNTGILEDPRPNSIASVAESDTITAGNIRDDLWGLAIKPMLCSIAQGNISLFEGNLKNCVNLSGQNNTQALEALSRIESGPSDSEAEGCVKPRSCYTPACSMTLAGAESSVDSTVAHHIAETIGRESIQSFSHNNLWGKLINSYCGTFMLTLVPQVDKALVVPSVTGLRDTYCKSIKADDYVHIDIRAVLTRPLRAVAVSGGNSLNTNVFTAANDAPSLSGIGGCWSPEEPYEFGMIYIVQAPAWIYGLPSAGHSPSSSFGKNENVGGISTNGNNTPGDQGDKLIANVDKATKEDLIKTTGKMYDAWAHAVYISETLRQRSGQITGKLRFDISPGSNVRIEGTSERFLEDDKLGQDMVGRVIAVSISLNAETSKAGTSFQLTDMRTVAENEDEKTSIEKHPLYETTFLGAPLIDAYWFQEEGEGDCCEAGTAPDKESLKDDPDPERSLKDELDGYDPTRGRDMTDEEWQHALDTLKETSLAAAAAAANGPQDDPLAGGEDIFAGTP